MQITPREVIWGADSIILVMVHFLSLKVISKSLIKTLGHRKWNRFPFETGGLLDELSSAYQEQYQRHANNVENNCLLLKLGN